MITPQPRDVQKLRIRVEELKTLLQSDHPVTVLDVRNHQAGESSSVKIRGAIHIQSGNRHADPFWPKDRLMVVY